MKKETRITMQKLIWCRIRYYQRLHDIPDAVLAGYLCVNVRTLRQYDRVPDNITLGRLDSFLVGAKITLTDLLA